MKSKKDSFFFLKATKIFTDRDMPRSVFETALEELKNDKMPFQVLMYYGVGGIGKTTLLKHLKTECVEGVDCIGCINLAQAAENSRVEILINIRRLLNGPYILFDYAVAKLYTELGKPLSELKKQNLPNESILFDFLDVAADLAEIVAPARLLKRCLAIGSNKIEQYISPFKRHLAQIDAFGLEDLHANLPMLLGAEIEKNYKGENKFVFFFDTHEHLMKKERFHGHGEPDDWLRELIESANIGLWVIAGREKLKWGIRDSEWNAFLQQHILGRIGDADAHFFLKNIPVCDERLRDAIIESAKGVPLYLDLCAESYLRMISRGEEVDVSEFNMHEDEVVHRFLSHLGDEERMCLRLMSIPMQFDYGLFSQINASFNLPLTLAFDQFCQSSYCNDVNSISGMYSVHDIVRDYTHDNFEEDILGTVAQAMIKSLEASSRQNDSKRMSWLLVETFSLLFRARITLDDKELSLILDAGNFVINAGEWNSLLQFFATHGVNALDDPEQKVVAQYIQAFSIRRSGQLVQALQAYSAIDAAQIKGRMKTLVELQTAHCRHLLGEYALAESRYNTIFDICAANGDRGEICREVSLRLADLKLIKGEFRDALGAVDRILANEGASPLFIADVLRCKGHVMRFNCRYGEAMLLYSNVRDAASQLNADNMLGKALTNMVEAQCFDAPASALKIAKEAVDINTATGAGIELSKLYSAMSIAHLLSNDIDSAVRCAKKAFDFGTSTGYKSGILFSRLSEYFCRFVLRDFTACEQIYVEIVSLQDRIGVYPFLLLIPARLQQPRIPQTYSKFSWIDTDSVQAEHTRFIARLSCPLMS